MNYYGVVRKWQDDHLEHLFGFGSKKGSEKKNHKYIMRIPSGKGFKYLYTTAEVAAYKAGTVGKVAKDGAKSLSTKIGFTQLKRKNDTEKMYKGAKEKLNRNSKAAATALEKGWARPGSESAKSWAKTIVDNSKETKVASKEYQSAKKAYDKSLLGKAENAVKNNAVSKAAGNAAKSVKDIFSKKKNPPKDDSITYTTFSSYDEDGNPVKDKFGREYVTKYKFRKDKKSKQYNVSGQETVYGNLTENGNFQWDNRPHSRVVKKKKGTAVVKKGSKVGRKNG